MHMRVFLLLFLISSLFLSCENKQKQEALNASESAIPLDLRPSAEKHPIMEFDQPVVYLGRVTQGDSARYTFHFKNKGNMPLKIMSVNASCGCTTPKWSQDLIQPGKKGFIKVTFNSAGKEGKVQKTITAYCNTIPADNTVAFKIEVIK
ncbi:MAG: hypothetical protein RL246_1163 [Bacteroidota bacterium]|jgi:hypothetical protein